MMKPIAFVSLWAVGAIVMFAFDNTFTLLAGIVIQLAAVVIGIFAIATPEFLTGDEGESAQEE